MLGGHPVLEILGRDDEGRPVRVLVVLIMGNYDGRMHGWRAAGFAVTRSVEWDPDGTSRMSGPAATRCGEITDDVDPCLIRVFDGDVPCPAVCGHIVRFRDAVREYQG